MKAVSNAVIIGAPVGIFVAGIIVALVFAFVFYNFKPVRVHHLTATTVPTSKRNTQIEMEPVKREIIKF